MLPQSAAVAFVLAKVAVNGAVMECDPVVSMQVGAYLFGTEFAADKGVDVLNHPRLELIGFSRALFGQPALPLCFFGTVLLPLGMVPFDFATDGAFVAVKLFGDFGDGTVAGQVLDMVSFVLGQLCVAHGNLSCRKGRMLPHTGLFLLWKVALQMRIRRRLKTSGSIRFVFRRPLGFDSSFRHEHRIQDFAQCRAAGFAGLHRQPPLFFISPKDEAFPRAGDGGVEQRIV